MFSRKIKHSPVHRTTDDMPYRGKYVPLTIQWNLVRQGNFAGPSSFISLGFFYPDITRNLILLGNIHGPKVLVIMRFHCSLFFIGNAFSIDPMVYQLIGFRLFSSFFAWNRLEKLSWDVWNLEQLIGIHGFCKWMLGNLFYVAIHFIKTLLSYLCASW